MVAISGKRNEIQIDVSRWPIIVSTGARGEIEDSEWLDYLTQYSELLKTHGEPYVAVVDLRDGGSLTAKQRKQLGEVMENGERHPAAECLGQALVFNSALMRRLLTAVLWLAKPDYEIKVFTELEDAIKWGEQLVDEHRERKYA